MTPSALLQEYCRCLERDFRRGHTGVCTDLSLKELLWRHLLEDPELHCTLHGDDLFPMLAAALQGHLDLVVALQNLCQAFEVLELAAVNLYFFPWRKEFSSIKTFSGVYVHVLQGVLSDAAIAKSFRRLGYVQKDNLHLALSQLPSGANLLCAACSFFAVRVECEILAKIVEALEPRGVLPEQLLQARRETRGSLEVCVAKLQSLVHWPQGKKSPATCPDGVDLYRGSPETTSPYRDVLGARLSLCEHGSSSPRLRSKEQHPSGPQESMENRSKVWTPGQEQPYRNGVLGSEGPDPETSFSFISLRRELSRTTDTDYPVQLGSQFLSPYDSPGPQPRGANRAASPSFRQSRSPQLSPAGTRRAQRLGGGGMGVMEPPCYHLHSCLRPGALPSSCCSTCRLLHGSSCELAQICRSHHQVEELQSEKQQRLWLQRIEVDMLLHEGGGAWQ